MRVDRSSFAARLDIVAKKGVLRHPVCGSRSRRFGSRRRVAPPHRGEGAAAMRRHARPTLDRGKPVDVYFTIRVEYKLDGHGTES
jgi:hypothetical protein